MSRYVILTATDAVTRRFAEIYARFRDQLKGSSINDMWIAATRLAQPGNAP